jgi:ribosome-associated protein
LNPWEPHLDIRKLQRAIVDGLEDVKAHNIVVFNTEALSPLFERVIIASGTSNRQTKALASSVRETVKKRGLAVLRTEGEDNGEWIIVDCGAAVAHIMQPAIRDYYHLEEIWGAKPVRLKGKGDVFDRGLPKASEPADAPVRAPRPAAPKTAARSTAGKTAAAKHASAKKANTKKANAKKAPAKSARFAKSPAAKSTKRGGARSPAAAKSPPRKTPARKTPARTSGARPAPRKAGSSGPRTR